MLKGSNTLIPGKQKSPPWLLWLHPHQRLVWLLFWRYCSCCCLFLQFFWQTTPCVHSRQEEGRSLIPPVLRKKKAGDKTTAEVRTTGLGWPLPQQRCFCFPLWRCSRWSLETWVCLPNLAFPSLPWFCFLTLSCRNPSLFHLISVELLVSQTQSSSEESLYLDQQKGDLGFLFLFFQGKFKTLHSVFRNKWEVVLFIIGSL